MDSIKLSVLIPPQSVFCISTATFCIPSQILILLEIHTETIGSSELISANTPSWSSTHPTYNSHRSYKSQKD